MGAAVFGGWVVGLDIVTRVRSDWVSMKPTTSLAFVGIGVAFALLRGGAKAQTLSLVAAMHSTWLMAMAAGDAFGVASFLVDSRIVPHDPGDALTISPGQPSHCTMLAFVALSGAVLMQLLDHAAAARALCALVACLGAVALVGYLTDTRLLYCYWSSSTAMAAHTAGGFTALGLSGYALMRRDLR